MVNEMEMKKVFWSVMALCMIGNLVNAVNYDVCVIGWNGINEKEFTVLNKQTISRCAINTDSGCGGGTTTATTCEQLFSDNNFLSYLSNFCGCSNYPCYSQQGVSMIIDHTGCGLGTVGCGDNKNGKNAFCSSQGHQVISANMKIANTVEVFSGTGTETSNSCTEIERCNGVSYAKPISWEGECAIVNQYNYVHCTTAAARLSPVIDLLNGLTEIIDAFGRSIPSLVTIAVYIAVGGAVMAFVALIGGFLAFKQR